MLNAFTCELAAGCTSGDNYVFTSGGAGVGSIVVSDSDVNPQTGILELGLIDWDSLGSGSLYLSSCNYTDAGATERTCSPSVHARADPEPGTGVLLGLALTAFGVARRRAH